MKHYPIKYKVEFGEFTKEQIKQEEAGGCDAVIIHSLIFPEDGSRSEVVFSSDGRSGQELSHDEYFKSMMGFARALSTSDKLPEGKQIIAALMFEMHRCITLCSSDRADKERLKPIIESSIDLIEHALVIIKKIAAE